MYLNGPSSICSDIKLDASSSGGNAGRPFLSVKWTLTSFTGSFNPASLYLFLESSKELTMLIPEGLLPSNSTYVFTISLTNWVGGSSSASILVSKPDGFFVPIYLSSPTFQNVRRTEEIILESASRYDRTNSYCNFNFFSGIPTFSLQWFQLFTWPSEIIPLLESYAVHESPSQDILNLKSLFFATRTLVIPSNTLLTNQVYAFKVVLTVLVNNITTSFAAFSILKVVPSALSAIILGGSSRTLYEPVILFF